SAAALLGARGVGEVDGDDLARAARERGEAVVGHVRRGRRWCRHELPRPCHVSEIVYDDDPGGNGAAGARDHDRDVTPSPDTDVTTPSGSSHGDLGGHPER